MAAPRRALPLASARDVVIPPHLPPGGEAAGGGGGGRLVYRVKLTDDLVEQMRGAERVTIAMAGNAKAATMFVGDEEIDVKFRPADDRLPPNEFCFSHRHGGDVRSVAVVAGEADVRRTMSKNISSITKKRTLEAANDKKKSSTLIMSATEEPKQKRSRPSTGSAPPRRTVTEKRPRARSAASPPNGIATSLGGIGTRRIPASVLPTSTPSPHVSPPGLPSSARHQAAMSARATAALGNGHRPPRGTPPVSSGLAAARVSAAPSPAASRGPSPARLSSAPSSPRTSNHAAPAAAPAPPPPDAAGGAPAPAANGGGAASAARGKELRRHITHLLALQDMSASEMKSRLGSVCSDFEQVRRAVQPIGTMCAGSKYKLKPAHWADVTAEYDHYSMPERDFIRRELENRRAGGAPTATGSGSSQGSVVSPSTGDGSPDPAVAPSAGKKSSAAAAAAAACPISGVANGGAAFRAKLSAVDAELDKFVAGTVAGEASDKSFAPIACADDEARYRASFHALWKQYCALHAAMVTMQTDMSAVRDGRKVAKLGDLAALDVEVASFVRALKVRWESYCAALHRVHRELQAVKGRIVEWDVGR